MAVASARKLRIYFPFAVPPPQPRVIDMSCWRIGGPRGFRTDTSNYHSETESDVEEDVEDMEEIDGDWVLVSDEESITANHEGDREFVANGYLNTPPASARLAVMFSDVANYVDYSDYDDDDGDGVHASDRLSGDETFGGSGSDCSESQAESHF
jgi:hypothetical protein